MYSVDLKDLREPAIGDDGKHWSEHVIGAIPDLADPEHYKAAPLEHWDALESWSGVDRRVPLFVLLCLTHVFSYMWRVGLKNDWRDEVRKMINWLERALEYRG